MSNSSDSCPKGFLLASRPPSSSRRPPQAKTVRVDLHRCDSELSEKDLVDLRSRYDIPSSVMLLRPRATDHANAPPPGLRKFFAVALSNGLRLPVHPYVGEVLSVAGVGPAQLTPNIWISIIGFYSACLLASVMATAEFFLIFFSQCTQKDGFLYFTVRTKMKGFCEAFSSKVEKDTWRPIFFYTLGEGLPQGVPFDFMAHLKSHGSLPRSSKYKADEQAFSTYWEDKLPMPLHFYTDRCVMKATGLSHIADVDIGGAEGSEFCYDRPPAPASEPVVVSSSSEEDGVMRPFLRRYLPLSGLTSFVEPLVASILTWAARHRPRPPATEAFGNPQNAAPKTQDIGTDTSLSLEGHFSSSSLPSPLDQSQSPLPAANHAPIDAHEDVSGKHFSTVVLEPTDYGGVGSTTP
ncbi:hypothetical protein LIER_07037 [Lithospermum erythrorhizon]|uniref:Transposase (putative) gypsy type domain-containing protein n=1 Tax=Lithospermum erythrorhizon TaxID=34254 RepID=A0AAV3P7I4_LITER